MDMLWLTRGSGFLQIRSVGWLHDNCDERLSEFEGCTRWHIRSHRTGEPGR